MTKPVNYTEAQTAEMVEMYIAVASESEARRNEVVEELAAKFNKSVRSIRAKLSRENVYIAKKPTAKDGSAVVRKEQLVTLLSTMVGLPVESAINMTKRDLKNVIVTIRDLREAVDSYNED